MSYSISGTNIKLTRGDTLFAQISITKDGEAFTPEEGDSIRFAAKKRITDKDTQVVINKKIPIDTLLLELEPQDTKSLPFNSNYVYDIEYTDSDGHVDTFIKGMLHIEPEVY